MNSHQSLAEALEMCKYTENFTSRVGGGGGDEALKPRWPSPTPENPPDSNRTPSSTYSSISGYSDKNQPPPRIKEHNTATSEVTYSCVYQQFYHLRQRDRKKAPQFTSRGRHRRPRERLKWGKCCAIDGGGGEHSRKKPHHGSHTHTKTTDLHSI